VRAHLGAPFISWRHPGTHRNAVGMPLLTSCCALQSQCQFARINETQAFCDYCDCRSYSHHAAFSRSGRSRPALRGDSCPKSSKCSGPSQPSNRQHGLLVPLQHRASARLQLLVRPAIRYSVPSCSSTVAHGRLQERLLMGTQFLVGN
jgi:hypothetical protein